MGCCEVPLRGAGFHAPPVTGCSGKGPDMNPAGSNGNPPENRQRWYQSSLLQKNSLKARVFPIHGFLFVQAKLTQKLISIGKVYSYQIGLISGVFSAPQGADHWQPMATPWERGSMRVEPCKGGPCQPTPRRRGNGMFRVPFQGVF